jgi:hypothetical protein
MSRVRLSATIPKTQMDEIETIMKKRGTNNKSMIVEEMLAYYLGSNPIDKKMEHMERKISEIESLIKSTKTTDSISDQDLPQSGPIYRIVNKIASIEEEILKLKEGQEQLKLEIQYSKDS